MFYCLIIIAALLFFIIGIGSFESDGWYTISCALIIIAVVLGVCTCYIYSTADAHEAQLEQEYDALVYKSESDAARDELGFLNKEYIDEIEDWNTSLAFKKNICRNFWVGVFYPNIYDDLDYIDYHDIQYRRN